MKSSISKKTITYYAFFRETDKVKSCLEHGADPNYTDGDGKTSLHYASNNQQVKMAELLLKRGAEPNKRDNEGLTPFAWHPFNIHPREKEKRLVQLFLNFGCKTLFKEYNNYDDTIGHWHSNYAEWPIVATLKTLCIRVVYLGKISTKDFPGKLLEFPDEIEEKRLYESAVQAFKEITT